MAVSPEQANLVGAIRNFGKASLAHDAKVHHLLLDKIAERTDRDLSSVANIGYSRGAMVGFGLQGYAGQHDRQQIYNDYVDPCLEHGVRIDEIPWLQVRPYVARELGAIASAALPKHGRTVPDLIPTLKHQPSFWLSQVSTGVALFRGEAGKFIDSLPTDSHTHVTLFSGSIFNQASAWERRLAGFPNITVTKRDGVHFTGAHMDIIKDTLDRVMTAAAA